MKKLLAMAALGGVAWGARKLTGRGGGPDTTKVDMDKPQKTVERVESKVGEPVRP